MKHYKFPADAFIGYIRIARPGSVLGPQQQFLNEMQDLMFEKGEQHRKKFNLTDDLCLKLTDLKISEDKKYMSDTTKKIAEFGDKGQGENLTSQKAKKQK